MIKKLLKGVLALCLVSSLVACSTSDNQGGEDKKDVVTLKVWGSQDDQTMLQEMIEAFKANNPDKEWNISLGVVGEPDASKVYLEDPAAAADVFAFANDQLKDLVAAGALYEVTRNKDAIIAANGEGSVGSATLDGKLYAYPMTADNGYFMYYDKSVFSEEDVKSLDKMMEVANAKGKKIFMDVSNGWYIASFFLSNGGVLGLDAEGNQICDFNNAAGVEIGEYIKKFTADPSFMTGADDTLQGGMGSIIAAGVSGVWNASAMQDALGDNYAATKLPEINLGSKSVQLSSFGGYKLIGVNSQTQFPVEAMDLAEWLTNEENQIKRFQMREAGPSNVNAAASPEVNANVALAALSLQSQYSVSQNDVLGGYWSPAEAFGEAMENKDYSKSIQEMLDSMVEQITAK